jgi:hypothetical protein
MIFRNKFTLLLTSSLILSFILFTSSYCKVYKFNDISIPPDIKTIHVRYIENKARYQNPQLSPQLTDRLRQKIVSQTRLTQVNTDNADYDVSGEIVQYDVITSGISDQQVSSNRLTVSVNMTVINKLTNEEPKKFAVSRSFEFPASASLAQAESRLLDDMVRNLSDEIFNRIFSDW